MLQITSAQIDTWLTTLIWPLARILGVLGVAPVIGERRVPARVRIGLGVGLALVLIPTLPAPPAIAPASGAGMVVLATQVTIGLAIGFAMRLVFAAIEMAGDLMGTQMGLGFALFYDPGNAQHTPVLGQFLNLLAVLAFLSINGHLMMISALADSFRALPVGGLPPSGSMFSTLVQHGATVFAAALQLSLPMIMTMLVVNMALGVLTRAAPQLNIFAVGFPITLAIGFATLLLVLPWIAGFLERAFVEGVGFAASVPAR